VTDARRANGLSRLTKTCGVAVNSGSAHRVRDHVVVEVASVQDAQLAALHAHVVQDAGRRGLAQRELVAAGVVLAHQPHKRVHHERVVLRGHAKHAAHARAALVLRLQEVRLLHHLPRVREEARALFRQLDARTRPREDRDAHLALELCHGLRQAGLRHEQPLCRRREGARFRHLDHVSQLLQLHAPPPSGPF